MNNFRDGKDIYPELTFEATEGDDAKRAEEAVRSARADSRRTDEIIIAANKSFGTLRKMHEENHFIEKLRLAIRGV